jgi:hypothetical protein
MLNGQSHIHHEFIPGVNNDMYKVINHQQDKNFPVAETWVL